jgi:hypothetical protein
MVKFIKRQTNIVVHTLARAAIRWVSRCTFETLPLCITLLLNNDISICFSKKNGMEWVPSHTTTLPSILFYPIWEINDEM